MKEPMARKQKPNRNHLKSTLDRASAAVVSTSWLLRDRKGPCLYGLLQILCLPVCLVTPVDRASGRVSKFIQL